MWREELTRRFPALSFLGHCYVVGGAIRDLLMEREPADVDIACDDPLAAARLVGSRVIPLGTHEHLRAYRVVAGDKVYDFAETLDHDIQADLGRRDFTVNAMGVDLARDELLDPHGGRKDIQSRVVRMVDASNFDDDPLRALKGVRMAVSLAMTIDEETIGAIEARAPRIVEIAAERVAYELSIIFSSGAATKAVQLLERTGLAEPLGLRPRTLHSGEVSLSGAYALLVDDPRAFGQRWRLSGALVHEVMTLRKLIDHHDPITLYDAGEAVARQLPAILRALGRKDDIEMPDFSVRAFLTGEEIATLTGLAPGKELGAIKRALLEAQIRGEVTSREDAERFVGVSSRA
jgi:hypothetical protein